METFVTAYQSKDVSEMLSVLLLLFGVISFVRLTSDAIGVCCPRNDRLTELVAEVQHLRATVDSLETLDDKMNEIKSIVSDLSAHLGIQVQSDSDEETSESSEETETSESQDQTQTSASTQEAEVEAESEPAASTVTDSQNLFEHHSEDSTNTIVNPGSAAAAAAASTPKKRTRTKAPAPAPAPAPSPPVPSPSPPVTASSDKSSDKHVMLKGALKSGDAVYLSYKKTTFTAKFVLNASAPHGYYLKSDNTDYNTPSHFSFAKKSSVNPSIHSDNGWDSVYVLMPASGNGKPSKVCLNDLINK
jgi:hypothetical protein